MIPEKPFSPGIRAAFFDVDGTLVQGDTQQMEAVFGLRHNLGAPCYMWSLFKTWIAQELRHRGVLSLERQNQIYIQSYRGMARETLVSWGKSLFETRVRDRLFPGACSCVAHHRARGDLTVLISASTSHLLAPLARFLKVDRVCCTELEFDEAGTATGRALGPVVLQMEKRRLVRSLTLELGINLSVSHAYSDHHSDIPLLSSVGHPVAVNPTPELERHCHKMGWTVQRFFASTRAGG